MSDLKDDFSSVQVPTLEAMVVRVADRIAYVNHDLDDCLRAGFLQSAQIPADIMATLGHSHSQRVGAMVRDLIQNSLDRPRLNMSEEIIKATDDLKDFLWDNLYDAPRIQEEAAKVAGIIHNLFELYMVDDGAFVQITEEIPRTPEERAQMVCDYVAGMTDRFARAQYLHHFLPAGFPSFEEPQ